MPIPTSDTCNTYFTCSQRIYFKFLVYRDRIQVFHASIVDKAHDGDCGHDPTEDDPEHALCLETKCVLDIQKPQRILVHSTYNPKFAECLVQVENVYFLISTSVSSFVLEDDYIVELKVHCCNGVSYTSAIGFKYVYVFLNREFMRCEKNVVFEVLENMDCECDIATAYFQNSKLWEPIRGVSLCATTET